MLPSEEDEISIPAKAEFGIVKRLLNLGILEALDNVVAQHQQDVKILQFPFSVKVEPTYEMLAAQHTAQRASLFRLIEQVERRVVGLDADLQEHASDREQGALDALANLLPELYAVYGGDEIGHTQRLGGRVRNETAARKQAQEKRGGGA